MNMGTGTGPGQEYVKRMRKAHFWMRASHWARLTFAALFGVTILVTIIAGLFSATSTGVSMSLFAELIFVLIGLLVLASLAIIASNFLKNLYQPGSPCDYCNCMPANCSGCGYQKLTRLDGEKDGG